MNGTTLYSDGTAAVTNGSANIVGTTTVWSSLIDGDVFLGPDSHFYELTIVDDTHATIVPNYIGSTVGGAAYQIFKSSAARDSVRTGSKQLTALANLYRAALNLTSTDQTEILAKGNTGDLAGLILRRGVTDLFQAGAMQDDNYSIRYLLASTWTKATGVDGTTGAFTIFAQLMLGGIVSPSALGGDVNDYNPTGMAQASVLRLSSSGAYHVTGIAGGAKGRVLVILNANSSSTSIFVDTESASSTAANRIALLPSNIQIDKNQALILLYDDVSSRWRVLALPPSAIIGDLNISSTTVSSSSTTGALKVAGGVGIAGALNVAGAVGLSSTLNVTGTTTLGVLSAGATTLSSTLNVTGTTTLGVLSAGATTLSAALSVPAGVVGTPSINFGSATTGIWSSAAGKVSISSAGVKVAEFTSAGLEYTSPASNRNNLGVRSVLRNERLAKNGNYTLDNADTGKTIALGGNAFFTLTAPDPAGMDIDFQVEIVNEDGWTSGRAKTNTLVGLGTFLLYPTGSYKLFVQNGAWRTDPPVIRVRPSALAAVVLNVDADLGVNTSDGLATGTGAFKDYNTALYTILQYFDISSFPQGTFKIQGKPGNIETQIIHYSPHSALGGQGGATILIDGGGGEMRASAGHFINAVIQYDNIIFKSDVSLDYHATVELRPGVVFGPGGSIFMVENTTLLASGYTISGNSANHLINTGGRYSNSGAITFATDVTFSNAFLLCTGGQTNIGGFAGGHTVTGPAYQAYGSAIINTTGSIPGTVAGFLDDSAVVNGVRATTSVAEGGTGSTTAGGARTNLGLVIGSDVQGYDVELAAIAGLISASDRLPYFSAPSAAALAVFTSFGRSVLACVDAAAGRTVLGLGTLAVQNAAAIAITGGTIAGVTATDLAISSTATITGASANALTVGRLGATTPALKIDTSVASSITGLQITGRATTAGVDLLAIGETNVNLRINAAGSGTIGIGTTSTGNITLGSTSLATVAIACNTASTTTANGALTIAGGLGVAGTINAGAAVITTANGNPGLSLRSGASGSYTSLSIGRTGSEGLLSIASGSNNWITGDIAGDIVLRAQSGNLLLSASGSADFKIAAGTGVITVGPGFEGSVSDANTSMLGSSGQFVLNMRNRNTTDNNWAGFLFWNGVGQSGPNLSAGIMVQTTNHTSGLAVMHFCVSGGVSRMHIGATGGLVVGAAIGDDKGTGHVNLAGDIWKNNASYTNPDFVFEHFYHGKIERFADRPGAKDYSGLMPYAQLREHTRSHLRLPGITDAPAGAFERGDWALRYIEDNTLRILDLHERVMVLETSKLREAGW